MNTRRQLAPSPPPSPQTPALRLHKGSGQGYVQLDGSRHYLGVFRLPETQARYDRLIAEWLAAGRRLPIPPNDITVVELAERFLDHAERYYVKDGQQTGEVTTFKAAMKPLKELYGRTAVKDFGPIQLKALRTKMIGLGWCRRYINAQVGRVRMIFKWGVSKGLVEHATYGALTTVAGLKRGRCPDVQESEPVRPVRQEHIDAIEAHVSRQIWALVELQLLTGARPGELVAMRPMDLDTTGKVWTYTPSTHKTEHHGHGRTIYLGPQAQEIVTKFLAARPTDKPLFSPAEAEAERREKLTAARKTPASCGNVVGSNRRRRPEWKPGDAYDVASYRRAIQRACELAKIPSWHPHQLRHNAATRLRREFGIDLAQTILGHRLGSAIMSDPSAEVANASL